MGTPLCIPHNYLPSFSLAFPSAVQTFSRGKHFSLATLGDLYYYDFVNGKMPTDWRAINQSLI